MLKDYADKADLIVAVSSALANKLQSCGTETPVSVVLNGFRIQNRLEGMHGRGCALSRLDVWKNKNGLISLSKLSRSSRQSGPNLF